MARISSVVGTGKLVASAFLAMEQGKSTENVAINAAEVVAIHGQYGIQEKEKCMLVETKAKVGVFSIALAEYRAGVT